MARPAIFLLLIFCFFCYSFLIYTEATEKHQPPQAENIQLVNQGKLLYQDYNCQACHQIFGLGGYLGPDLTTAISDSNRGIKYVQAMLQSGGNRMPDFGFSKDEVAAITEYLIYVDATARAGR